MESILFRTYAKPINSYGFCVSPDLYRAVDKEGNTVDFMLSEKRDEPAARKFLSNPSAQTTFQRK